MEKKQSSIEWLVQELNHNIEFIPLVNHWDKIRDIIQQAKKMHKYEILETFEKAYVCGYRDNGDGGIDYYNETFGGENEQ